VLWCGIILKKKKDPFSLLIYFISAVTAGLKPFLGNPGASIFQDVTFLQEDQLWKRWGITEALFIQLLLRLRDKFIYLCLYSPCGPWPLFQFLNLYTLGTTPWIGVSPSQDRYLHTEQHKYRLNRINAHRHPCLEWVSNSRSQCSSGQRRFMP
jgi:hypothetical protein